MEILTLLKANIKKKKDTFISIVFLMTIISAVLTSLISVQDNYRNAVKAALQREAVCDMRFFFPASALPEEVRLALEGSELVENVEYYSYLHPDFIENEGVYSYSGDNLQTLRRGLKFYQDDLSSLENGSRTIGDGEIYLTLGRKSLYQCEIGDQFIVKFGEKAYNFTLKGFVEEPMGGASSFAGNVLFISQNDFDRISRESKAFTTPEKTYDYIMVCISGSGDYRESSTKLARKLTLELKEKTGYVVRNSITGDQAYKFTVILPDVLINMALVFAVFLFVVVLVVMSHSIGAEIETDYVTIGILKAQGFDSGKIRMLFILRYLLAQVLGILLGCVVSLPIERAVSRLCMFSTGILPERNISLLKVGLLMLTLVVICAVLILLRTRRAAKISPVRAISGGRREIYFHSRIQVPVDPQVLSASLAFRQITSGLGRYAGVLLIVGILTFFMITVNLIGNILSSKTAQHAMGLDLPDLEVGPGQGKTWSVEAMEAAMNEAERIIDQCGGTYNKQYCNNVMLFYDGDSIYCEIYKYPEGMDNILKGRAPIYDNEILITEIAAEAYDLKIGDKMRLAYGEKEKEFIIVGFFQKSNDAGMVLGMSFESADWLGVPHRNLELGYMFNDPSVLSEVKGELDEKLGDILQIVINESVDDAGGIAYTAIVKAMQAFIYIFSTIFAFVAVRMVVSKAFVRERTDIGIYKAMGFTANRLRFGFALRFMITAVTGAVMGAVLSAFASKPVLTAAFRIIGISRVFCDFTALTVIVPVVYMGAAFLVFSFLVSERIRKVQVRELVAE